MTAPPQNTGIGIADLVSHWNVRENPFSERIETRYLYLGRSHRQNYNRLKYFVEDGFSHVDLLTGPVGLGKTMLLRKMREDLSATTTFSVYMSASNLTLRKALNDALSVMLGTAYYSAEPEDIVLAKFERAYRELGRPMALIVDEAQGLSMELLRSLVSLTNLACDDLSPPCLVLGGTRDLVNLVRGLPDVESRIAVFGEIEPLAPDEVGAYVQHRMHVAGYAANGILSPGTAQAVHDRSGGIPRVVNQVMRRALMVAWGNGQRTLTPAMIAECSEWATVPQA